MHAWVTSHEFQEWVGELMERYENKSERLALLLKQDDVLDARVEAARMRLQQTTSRADAYEAIREIVANLFGSEEMVLFGVDPPKHLWWKLWSFGVTDVDCCIWETLSEPILNCLFAGELSLATKTSPDAHHGSQVSVFVPIMLDQQTVAVLVIFRLLGQKSTVEKTDLDLLQVITQEAGMALFS
jgi:hypothetical protein